MYTQCPACKTVFNVKPEQLRAARGKVRCSRCQTIFNAAEHSYTPGESPAAPAKTAPPGVTAKQSKEKTQTAPTKPAPAVTAKQSETKPQATPQDKAERAKPAAPEKPAPATRQPANKKPPVATESDEDGWFDLTPTPATKPAAPKKAPAAPSAQETKAEPVSKRAEEEPAGDKSPPSMEDELNDDLFKLFADQETTKPAPRKEGSASAKKPETETVAKEKPASNEAKADAPVENETKSSSKEKSQGDKKKASSGNYSLPPQLESRPIRNTMRTLFFLISNLMLIAALAVQYAYIHRIPLRENANLRPWLDTLCQITSCPLPPRRDLKKIELVDNMMQSHPRYQNSLLITATLINRADYVQPYPIVEITMTDLKQKVVAQRTFRPEEYLAGDIAEMGFTPNVEVALMLEVADPGNNAVGFKFDFY